MVFENRIHFVHILFSYDTKKECFRLIYILEANVIIDYFTINNYYYYILLLYYYYIIIIIIIIIIIND